MTVTGHKIGGPYGVGALLLAREHNPVPVMHGGGQERHVRSGTLDVPAVAAFAVAVRLAAERREVRRRGRRPARRPGPRGARRPSPRRAQRRPGDRLPANAHFTFPGCEGDSLLLLLDAQGIECSTGSACTAGVAQPSHVLLATGADPELARGTLSFSFGHTSDQGGRRRPRRGDRPGGRTRPPGRTELDPPVRGAPCVPGGDPASTKLRRAVPSPQGTPRRSSSATAPESGSARPPLGRRGRADVPVPVPVRPGSVWSAPGTSTGRGCACGPPVCRTGGRSGPPPRRGRVHRLREVLRTVDEALVLDADTALVERAVARVERDVQLAHHLRDMASWRTM